MAVARQFARGAAPKPRPPSIEEMARRVTAVYRVPLLVQAATDVEAHTNLALRGLTSMRTDLQQCLAACRDLDAEGAGFQDALNRVNVLIREVMAIAPFVEDGKETAAGSETYALYHRGVYGCEPAGVLTL